jgi:tripeptide aminopeptidase
MKCLKKDPEVQKDRMEESCRISALNHNDEPIRGGTDGARLSFRGLPCPNLGNGGGNFHGRYEYCVIEELEQACSADPAYYQAHAGGLI